MDSLSATAPLLYKEVVVRDTKQLEDLFCGRKDSKVSSTLLVLLPILFSLSPRPRRLTFRRLFGPDYPPIPNQPLPFPLPNSKPHHRLRLSPHPPKEPQGFFLSLRRSRSSTPRQPPSSLPGWVSPRPYPGGSLLFSPPSPKPCSLHVPRVRGRTGGTRLPRLDPARTLEPLRMVTIDPTRSHRIDSLHRQESHGSSRRNILSLPSATSPTSHPRWILRPSLPQPRRIRP